MSTPMRIVSLVPSWTESLFVLGVGDRVVGVTRYCEEPKDKVERLPKVGGTKNPKLEAIAALQPDLVLTNSEENRAEDIAWLRDRFEVFEAMPRTVLDVADVLRSFGKTFACLSEIEPQLLEIEAQLLRCKAESLGRPPLRVFYPIWRKPWMSVNQDTYIHDLIHSAGGQNVCAGNAGRYPQLEDVQLQSLGADLVLLPSEPWAFTGEQRDALAASRTFGDAPLELVDGRDYCWHGTRTAAGIRRAHELFLQYRVGR